MTDPYILGFSKVAASSGLGIDELLSIMHFNSMNNKKSFSLKSDKPDNHSMSNSISESLALPISTILSAKAGKKLFRRLGTAKGLGLGLLANLGGAVAAAVTPTRTRNEQRNSDSSINLFENLLLPGVGMYNKKKREGYVARGSVFD